MTESARSIDLLRPLRILWRGALLVLHLLVGLPLALLAFLPGVRSLRLPGGEALRNRAHRLWVALLLRVLGIRPVVSGGLPPGPCLIAANHITWLDILLLHALYPARFVAKAEIRHWPLIGLLATLVGTVYIQRGSTASRVRVVRRLAALLRRGEKVAVFPEGGIVPEPGVARFHARIFAAAIRTGTPVIPVALRYARERDLHHELVFAGDQGFLTILARLLGQRSLRGEIMIGEPISSVAASRDELARRAYDVVSSYYGHTTDARVRRAK